MLIFGTGPVKRPGMKARKTDIPHASLVRQFLPADYSDSFRYTHTGPGAFSADDIQVSFWTDMPGWVDGLMNLRNTLVRPFGLKTEQDGAANDLKRCIREGGSFGFASVPAKSPDETVLLLSDKHLDAWLSVLVERSGETAAVTASTVVRFHNRLGRVYFFFIRPFHDIIVRKMLVRAVKKVSAQKQATCPK